MHTYDNLPQLITATSPAVCLKEHLADDQSDSTLAVPQDYPRKINFVRGGKVGKAKSARCGLYHNNIQLVQINVISI